MVAPWRVCGCALLLVLAAACSPSPTTPTTTARPSFTPLVAANRSATPTVTSTAVPPPTATATATEPAPPATSGAGTLEAATPADTPAAGTPDTLASVTPTPTGGPCTNDVDYIADLSVPDGTLFEPGQLVLKQWSVRNAGTCDWDASYRLVLVSGNALGARSELALYPARAGLEAVIEVAMLAPGEPGSYTGRWQARDPAGNVFGDRIFITIVVAPPATPTETETPSP